MNKLPTQSELHILFLYDKDTGVFTYRSNSNKRMRAGMIAGTNKNGYIRIYIEKVAFLAHRLAWLYVHGSVPDDCIDHKNGIKDDNRIANLRQVSVAENNQNRVTKPPISSGFHGVNWESRGRKWVAKIQVDGKNLTIGRFSSKDEASTAYAEAKKTLHPFQTQFK